MHQRPKPYATLLNSAFDLTGVWGGGGVGVGGRKRELAFSNQSDG